MRNINFSAKSDQQGIALVEVLVAILIFSIGILAIVGLQASMIKNTSESKFRADASFIAEERVGLMWADPANMASYTENQTALAELPQGTRTTTLVNVASGVQATITITWQQAGEIQHTYSTLASITGN